MSVYPQVEPSRRDALKAAATMLAAGVLPSAAAAEAEPVAFFLVGDTHYLANRDSPQELDERSRVVTSQLVDTLNALPGQRIPDEAGGGAVQQPKGVIHAGDLIDSGDKNGAVFEAMQRTEWRAFAEDFGADGKSGRLKFPVYEVHGNHDGPQGTGLVVEGIADRNKRRAGIQNVSANGLHYSWDWGPVHFVNLGIVVGELPEVKQKRRYNPLASLDFLKADLDRNVGDSKRPVLITHHIDLARYTSTCRPEDPANANKEWHPCDVRGFYEAIRKYNVAAILYGHTHARNVLRWDGASTKGQNGISVFNVDNSSHFHSDLQALFYFEVRRDRLVVRECATRDAWKSFTWTPQVWERPLAG